MYYNKYEGERIYLSPLSLEDSSLYTKWVNDESLSSGLSNAKFIFNDINEKDWVENALRSGAYNLAVIRKQDNRPIGIYGLEVKDQVSRRYHCGGFIGEKQDRGQGYGSEALRLITKFAFDILNAKTLFSGVFAFNQASLSHIKKAGYTVCGTFRNAYYYNGCYHDEYCIEITREDFYKESSNK